MKNFTRDNFKAISMFRAMTRRPRTAAISSFLLLWISDLRSLVPTERSDRPGARLYLKETGALLDPRTGHQFAMSVTTPPLPQVRRSAGCCTRAEIAISRPTSCALSKHIGICRRGGSGVRATGCAGNVFRTSIHRITNRTVASATSLISCSVGLDAGSAS